jgi:15-cis-phytoene synthase
MQDTTAWELASSYECCRALHRAHGRTYYLATRLLPRWKRRHVHALYGFTRFTDEIVDEMSGDDLAGRTQRLHRWAQMFWAAVTGTPVADPLLPAVCRTIEVFDLELADFAAFLRSMEMDLTTAEYPTYEHLLEYMQGSAAVIGTMMLPILGAGTGLREMGLTRAELNAAREPARQLGLAFQLTNFIRDVSEDLGRGRIYLPLKDLADFGVTPLDLRAGVATEPIRRLIAFEVDRAREHYARAAAGVLMLPPSSQRCIRTAFRLYGGILDEVVQSGCDVFAARATVPRLRRIAVAASSMLTPAGRAVAPAGRAVATPRAPVVAPTAGR